MFVFPNVFVPLFLLLLSNIVLDLVKLVVEDDLIGDAERVLLLLLLKAGVSGVSKVELWNFSIFNTRSLNICTFFAKSPNRSSSLVNRVEKMESLLKMGFDT